MKKRNIIILSILVISLAIVSLYQTLASDVTTSNETPVDADAAFNFNLSANTNKQVTVNAGDTKVFDIKVTNSNPGTIQYGIAYQMITPSTLPENLTIAKLNTSQYNTTGTIPQDTSYIVTLIIINETESAITTSISTITGYEFGGDLIVPNGKTIITEEYPPPPPLVEHIKNQDPTDDNIITVPQDAIVHGDANIGTIPQNTEYRYSGPSTSVNNWVYFNCDNQDTNSNNYGTENYNYETSCERWRIIGVFNTYTPRINDYEERVKIIKATNLSNMAWDTANINGWTRTEIANNTPSKASLNTYLNEGIYNTTTLKQKAKDLTETARWCLGAPEYDKSTAETYARERSNNPAVASGTDDYDRDTSWEGLVGLMYPSDYGYASSGTDCISTKTLGSGGYDTATCKDNNWLFLNNSTYEWTMSPCSGHTILVFGVSSAGRVNGYSAYDAGNGVRPVLHLKSNVVKIDGDGTENNPFIIDN